MKKPRKKPISPTGPIKILRVWFVSPPAPECDPVNIYWEYDKDGDRISELLAMTDTVSKAGRIAVAMRATITKKKRRRVS